MEDDQNIQTPGGVNKPNNRFPGEKGVKTRCRSIENTTGLSEQKIIVWNKRDF